MQERVCLVVDDDEAVRRYLIAILERNGWQCLEAANALDARRVVESLHGSLHLVLTDIDMPGDMNGVGLARWVRAQYPRMPVVLVSGSGEVAPPEFPLVSKPCKPETVLKAVESLKKAAS